MQKRLGKRPRQRVRRAAGATSRGAGDPTASAGRFTIRPARQGDIPAVTKLDASITSLAKGPHWQDLLERSSARQTGHFFLVATSSGNPDALLGFIVGELRAWEFGSEPCGWVYALGVASGARGIGVGEALLDAIAREFRRVGMNKMRTMVAKHEPHPLNPFSKLIINAAITGMVPKKKDTPHVPVTVEEIIEDAVGCVAAGASILHLHARDEEDNPTYKVEVYAKMIDGIRQECPDVIICVTTSGRTYNEFEKRSEVLDLDGFVKPDMASLTLGSLNFPKQASINDPEMIMKLAEKMKEKGIMPELEIFVTGMVNTARYLHRSGYLSPPFYFNVILGSVYSTQARMSDLSYLTNLLPPDAVWACGGIGLFQLVVNTAAIVMGGHVRTGVEDKIVESFKTIADAPPPPPLFQLLAVSQRVPSTNWPTPPRNGFFICAPRSRAESDPRRSRKQPGSTVGSWKT